MKQLLSYTATTLSGYWRQLSRYVYVHTEYCSLRMFILGKDVHCCTCTMYISFTQGNHNLISHLVQSCGMLINTIGSAGVRYVCRIVVISVSEYARF